MDKEKIIPWLERMNAEPDGNKRKGIVAEMCKELALKTGEAWKLLKECGFEPKADLPDAPQDTPQGNPQGKPVEKKTQAVLRHKTEFPRYRCAGLVLTQKPETYQVTEAQLERLKRDCWVEIGEDKEAKAK